VVRSARSSASSKTFLGRCHVAFHGFRFGGGDDDDEYSRESDDHDRKELAFDDPSEDCMISLRELGNLG
jgi:hypothetical protein